MKPRTFVAIGSGIGLLIAACGTLAIYVMQRNSYTPKIFNTQTFVSEKHMISMYISEALQIHGQYKSGALSRAQTKEHALTLTVPAVLKHRHLEWVLNLDAGRDEPIEAMMQEYSTLTLVQ